MLTTSLTSLPWSLLGTVFSSGFVFGLAFALMFFAPTHRPPRQE